MKMILCCTILLGSLTATYAYAQSPDQQQPVFEFPFSYKKAQVIQVKQCINNVYYFTVKVNGKKIPFLFSPKVSRGARSKIAVGKTISVQGEGKSYFCIEQVLPLIVSPGLLVDRAY